MKKDIDGNNQKEVLDSSSSKNRNLFVVYLSFLVYLVIALLTLSDIDYYIPNSLIKLPLLSVKLPVYSFLVFASILLLVLHSNILWNLFFHIEKIKRYSMKYKTQSYHLSPYLFNFIKNGYLVFLFIVIFPSIVFFMLTDKALYFHDSKLILLVLIVCCLLLAVSVWFFIKIRTFYKVKGNLFIGLFIFGFIIGYSFLGFKYTSDLVIIGNRFSPYAGLEERLHTKGAKVIKPLIYQYPYGLDLSKEVLLKKQLNESFQSKLLDYNKTESDRIFLENVEGYNIDNRSFIGTNFSNSILVKTKFNRIDFNGVDFRDADCRNTTFKESKISDGKFQGSDLSYTIFKDSYIDKTIFGNMPYAKFSYVTFNKYTKKEKEYKTALEEYINDLKEPNPFGLNQRRVRLSTNRTIFDGNLSYSRFNFCKIDNIVGSSHMHSSIFWKSTISNSIFEGSDLKKTFFFFTTVYSSSFRNVNLSYSNFNGGSFSNCIFDDVNFHKTTLATSFNKCSFKDINFSEVGISHAMFRDTNMTNIDFSHTILYKLEFENVIFNNAKFNNSILMDVDFIDTNSSLDNAIVCKNKKCYIYNKKVYKYFVKKLSNDICNKKNIPYYMKDNFDMNSIYFVEVKDNKVIERKLNLSQDLKKECK